MLWLIGYMKHGGGLGEETLNIFGKMQEKGVSSDVITYDMHSLGTVLIFFSSLMEDMCWRPLILHQSIVWKKTRFGPLYLL